MIQRVQTRFVLTRKHPAYLKTAKVEHSDSCWISNVVQTLYSEGSWLSTNQPWTRVELRTLIYRPVCFYFLCLNLKSLQNKVRSFSLIFLLFQLFFIQSGNSSFQTFTSKSFFQVCYNFLKTGTLIFLRGEFFKKRTSLLVETSSGKKASKWPFQIKVIGTKWGRVPESSKAAGIACDLGWINTIWVAKGQLWQVAGDS